MFPITGLKLYFCHVPFLRVVNGSGRLGGVFVLSYKQDNGNAYNTSYIAKVYLLKVQRYLGN